MSNPLLDLFEKKPEQGTSNPLLGLFNNTTPAPSSPTGPVRFDPNDPTNLQDIAQNTGADGLLKQGALATTQGILSVPAAISHTIGHVFKPAEDAANKIDQFIAGIQPAQTGQNPNAEAAIQTAGYVGGQLYTQGKVFSAVAKGLSAIPTALEKIAPNFATRALTSIANAGRYVQGLAEQVTTPGRAATIGNAVAELPRNLVAGVGTQALMDPESVATPKGLAEAAAFSVGGALLDGAGQAKLQRGPKNIDPSLPQYTKNILGEISTERDINVPDLAQASADARFKLFDRFNPARIWQDQVNNSHLYEASRLYSSGSNGRVESMLNDGTFTLNAVGEPVPTGRPGFSKILRDGLKTSQDVDEYRAYMLAQRSTDAGVTSKGITFKNFTDADAQLQIANTRPEIVALGEQTKQYLQDLRQYGIDANVINEKSMMNLAFDNPNYIPLFRDVAHNIDPTLFADSQFGPGSVVKKLGNTTDLDVRDPIKNIEDLTSMIIRASDRNHMGQTLYSDILGNQAAATELGVSLLKGQDKFTNPEYYRKIQQIKTKLVDSGVADAFQSQFSTNGVEGLADGHVTDHFVEGLAQDLTNTFSKTFDRDHNILSVYGQDGIKQIQLSPELGKMYEALSPKAYNAAIGFASKVAGALKTGTTANPAFAVINAIRDSFDASIQSKYGFRFGVDSWNGFLESLERGRYAGAMRQEWMQAGGGHGTINSIGSDSYKNVFHSPLPSSTLGDIVLHPIQALKELSRPFEEAARLGEYIRGREQGATAVEAALNSRRVTTDFAQIGASMNALSQMTAFLNPSLQSLDQTYRTLFAENHVPTPFIPGALRDKLPQSMQNVRGSTSALMKGFAAISAPTAALWFANRNDQEIQDLRKTPAGATSWFVRLPQGSIAKVPKPFLYGQIFGTGMETVLDELAGKGDEDTLKAFGGSLWDQTSLNAIPNIASIPLQLWANKNAFTGGSIINDTQAGLDPQAQSTNSTTGTAMYVSKFLNSASGGAINVSPIHLDWLMQNLGGSSAKDITSIAGNGVARDAGDLPVFHRFIASSGSMNVQPIQKFYQESGKLEIVLNTVNKLVKDGDQDKLNTYLGDHMQDFAHAQIYAEARKQLGTMRSTIEQVHSMPGMSPESKREYIKYLTQQAVESARGVNQAISNTK